MKIAIIGATGNVGSKLVAEALSRGHSVTAIARDTGKLKPAALLTLANGDLREPSKVSKLLAGHDVVISSVHFQQLSCGQLVGIVKNAAVKRLLVVGGAGSLEVAPGVALVDTPGFPGEYKAEASAGSRFLEELKGEKELEWTFLSPSAMFLPDGRTDKFRLGKDQLLTDSKGESKVTMADFSIAMIDEAERPAHVRQRFTVVGAG